MEIRSHQPLDERPQPHEGTLKADITRPNRDGIAAEMGRLAEKRVEHAPAERSLVDEAAARLLTEPGADRVELSDASVALSDSGALPGPDGKLEAADQRAERVAGLSRELAEGRLFSSERLERAAARLLGED